MSEMPRPVHQHQAMSPPRAAVGRLPPGYRFVHVPVPEAIFNHAKAQAYLSGLRFGVFVAKVLSDCRPYQINRMPQPQSATPATESVEAGVSQP